MVNESLSYFVANSKGSLGKSFRLYDKQRGNTNQIERSVSAILGLVGYRTIWKRHTRINHELTVVFIQHHFSIVTKWHRFLYITARRAMYILFTKSEYSKLAVKIA